MLGIKLDYIKKKEKEREIPGRDDFFPEGEGLNSEHRTHEILCMVYRVLSIGQYLVCRNEYTCTIEFYFLIRNTRPGQMAYCKCGPR